MAKFLETQKGIVQPDPLNRDLQVHWVNRPEKLLLEVPSSKTVEHAILVGQDLLKEYWNCQDFQDSDMHLNELLPTVTQLSHQDKLRLIHFLLLEVAREEGCNLEPTDDQAQEDLLLEQLASTEAVVWSPYEADEAAQTLSELLMIAKQEPDA